VGARRALLCEKLPEGGQLRCVLHVSLRQHEGRLAILRGRVECNDADTALRPRAAICALLSAAAPPPPPPPSLASAPHRHIKAPAPQSAHRSTAAAARSCVGAGGASEGGGGVGSSAGEGPSLARSVV
jgi:hypothetical protein